MIIILEMIVVGANRSMLTYSVMLLCLRHPSMLKSPLPHTWTHHHMHGGHSRFQYVYKTNYKMAIINNQ